MALVPGTREYAAQLRRDIYAARQAADAVGIHLHSSFEEVCAEVRYWDSVAAHQLNQRIQAHNDAVAAERGRRANAREAARIQAAACGSCFTVHKGECY